jgi:Predicted membrane protein (DUF2142)
MKSRLNAAPGLFGVFLLLICLAWALGLPPGAGPDEHEHYVKALGVGGGDLYGRPPRAREPSQQQLERFLKISPEDLAKLNALAQKPPTTGQLWQRRTSREFTVPAGLSFPAFRCGYLGHGDWSCLGRARASPRARVEGSYVGTYQPYLYAPPGLVMRPFDDPQTALRAGRLVNAALSIALLLVAALVLWDGSNGALSLTGLIVAVTPEIVFFASVLNPSGPELTSAICFSACLLRLTRSSSAPGWVWTVTAASGTVLALSRSLGPIFVVLLTASVAVLNGWRPALAALKSAPRASTATAVTVAIACAAGAFWERRYQPHVPYGPGAIVDGLGGSIDNLPGLPKQTVGVFGATDIFMPLIFYVVWWLMLAALLAAAFYVGRGLERAALPALAVGIVAATLVLSAIYRQIGYELAARYILPLAVILPLWAGELLARHRSRLPPSVARWMLLAFAGAAAVVHAAAWVTHGRHVSGWTPPLGWWTWIVVVTAAAGAYAMAGVRAAQAIRQRGGARSPPARAKAPP